MEKSGLLLIKILSGLFVVALGFVLLYNFSISFREQVLTIYYKVAPEKTSYESKITSCNDTGKIADYFTKGVITVLYKNGVVDLYADSCSGSVIKEYSCALNNLEIREYICESGCNDGSCVVPSEEPAIIDENLSAFCGNYRITSPLNSIAQNEFSFYSSLNAIDGDLTTHWFGDPAHPYPKWIYFDFGEKVCISEADIYAFSLDVPMTGNLQASQDSIRWKTVVENITLTGDSMTVKLPQIVTARYIRWFETSSNRTYGSLTDARFKVADLPDEEKQNVG